MLEAITYTLAVCAAPWTLLVLLVGYQIGARTCSRIKSLDAVGEAVATKLNPPAEKPPAEKPKDPAKRLSL